MVGRGSGDVCPARDRAAAMIQAAATHTSSACRRGKAVRLSLEGQSPDDDNGERRGQNRRGPPCENVTAQRIAVALLDCLCARAVDLREDHSCQKCSVSKVRLDAFKHLCNLKGEQPCNGIECWRMRCAETQYPIGQSCGADKPTQQEHECHANHGAGDDVAWPMFSPIEHR